MTLSFIAQSIRRAPRRFLLAAMGVAFPVAILAATLFYVDTAVLSMTQTALLISPDRTELRAFFAGDLKWLRHYGFSMLDVPTLGGGLSS